MPRAAIVMLAKAPRPGQVKTRLIPPLDEMQAAALATAFLLDLVERLRDLGRELPATIIIAYDPLDARNEMRALVPQIRLLGQRGSDLGIRLRSIVGDLYGEGFERVVLIGSDSPTLPAASIRSALRALDDGADLAIAPADDGGYVLLAMRGPHPGMFSGIAWSTHDVYAQTLARAATLDLRVFALPSWYDVDEAADLHRLQEELQIHPDLAPRTLTVLRSLFEQDR